MSSVNLEGERRAFEDWAAHPDRALLLDRFHGGYMADETAGAWLAWQHLACEIDRLQTVVDALCSRSIAESGDALRATLLSTYG
jgi:hypothetical protein